MAAEINYELARGRMEAAYNTFHYTRDQFHQLEDEFVSLIEEMKRTKVEQVRNLSHLEGLRLRLMTSLDGSYKKAMNELADSMLATIGFAGEESRGAG